MVNLAECITFTKNVFNFDAWGSLLKIFLPERRPETICVLSPKLCPGVTLEVGPFFASGTRTPVLPLLMIAVVVLPVHY